MSTQVWVAGRSKEPGVMSELLGVFSSEEKAAASCVQSCDFIGPAVLDEAFPDETVEWPGAYYPALGKE